VTSSPRPDRFEAGLLTRIALRFLPREWRDSVQRDLLEEASTRPAVWRDTWISWQIVRVAARFRLRPGTHSRMAATPAPRPLSGLGSDVRLAIRTLFRQPASTLAIAGTLALGIGATTAIYAVFNFVLFRPVPGVSNNDRLVTVSFHPSNRNVSAYGSSKALPAMRAGAAAAGLERLGYGCCGDQLAVASPPGTQPTFEQADFVSSQFFDALGVKARLGRLLTDEEADRGSQNVVVISEQFWRGRLGGTERPLGQAIAVNGHPFVIIGVVDRFRGWGHSTRVGETDLWLPMGSQKSVTGEGSSMSSAVGRVRAGSSLGVIEQQLQAAYAGVVHELRPGFGAFMPFVDRGLSPSTRSNAPALRLYWLLMGAVALLLVLACANAANLLLARAAQRSRDTAVRLAIGAGRWRITRQFLIESLGLSLLAGGLGLGTAMLLTLTLRGMRLLSYFPDIADVEIDGRVVAFCLLVSVATILVFGLLPALSAARTDIHGVLGRGGRGVASSHRLRRGLVVVQIALSLTLVVGAGVLNRSLQNLFAADIGVNLNNIINLDLKPDLLGYSDRRSAQVVSDTMGGLRLAGFRDVAVSYPTPLTLNGSTITVRTAAMSAPQDTLALQSSVSPDYFLVMQIPLAGRTFTEAERHQPESVNPMPVVLSSTLARDLFGSASAIGRTFEMERYIGMAKLPSTALVIGVAGDTRSGAVRTAPRAQIYYARQSTWRYGAILVRSDEATGATLDRIRRVVRAVDPALPITTLRPLKEEVAEDLSEDRVLARLSAVVALLAALLAATGVVSVISQLVVERTRDFGIRTALGASAGDILGYVLKGVAAQSALGVALGLGLYWGISRWLATRLFGLGALDPITIAAAVMALLAIALVAAVVPARRATRIDPAVALRAD
jgi:predicted permease